MEKMKSTTLFFNEKNQQIVLIEKENHFIKLASNSEALGTSLKRRIVTKKRCMVHNKTLYWKLAQLRCIKTSEL
ncbi:MAG: hypothetical protein JSW04_11480 [Desulfobacterales bacterium]|nr:MAG: hypothetical protein JSW04_11480 [Desulfobacterales bacterium]